eukprot:8605933-Heterocapsa_arctica.AAC.1
MQSGVKQQEPAAHKKRWGQHKDAWADIADIADEDAEDVPGASTDINVESEDVSYARAYYIILL